MCLCEHCSASGCRMPLQRWFDAPVSAVVATENESRSTQDVSVAVRGEGMTRKHPASSVIAQRQRRCWSDLGCSHAGRKGPSRICGYALRCRESASDALQGAGGLIADREDVEACVFVHGDRSGVIPGVGVKPDAGGV